MNIGKKFFKYFVLPFLIVFAFLSLASFLAPIQKKIGVIYVNGVISDYMGYIKKLKKAEKDPTIKAVIIVVNSPGGSVGASQEIYRAIEKLRKKKPVVVSMGNVAASGGYYISAAANVIYANPGTITGSIGVIIQHINVNELLKKIGIKMENIKSGKNKDILYPNNELTPEQKRLLEETIKDVYEQFLDAIVKYRPIKKDKLRKIADGRIFSGKQAKELGLVDKLGNFEDAVEEAKKLGGIKGKAILYPLVDKKSFIEELLGGKLNFKNIIPVDSYSGLYYLMVF
jgi:protease-4